MSDKNRTNKENSGGRSASYGRGRTRNNPRADETGETPKNSGRSVSSGRAPVKRPETSVEKIDKKQKRELARIKKDEKWQSSVERIRVGYDRIFLVLVVILISIGIVMVYSASYPTAIAKGSGGFYYAGRHIAFALVGAVAMILTSHFSISFIKKCAIPFYGLCTVLLGLVLVMGASRGEAQRWIVITGDVRFQPSEFAKVALVMVLAWYADKMSDRYRNVDSGKSKFLFGVLYPSFFIFLYAGLIILEKHLSGTLIVVAIGVVVMFLAGASWKAMIPYYLGIGLTGAIAYVLYNPYALKRILTFADEDADILDEAWQTYQGMLAIGSGGAFGTGLGQGRQKFSYVSEAHNDFVFTIWCEEMGFVGAVIVIALFVALIFRGYRIALRAPDTFSSLLVFGIMTQLGVQVFLNLMVVMDIIPNTGIPLPFMSYGGTSLVVIMAEMGLVLSVSRRSYQKLQ